MVYTISCGIPAEHFFELLKKTGLNPLLLDTRRSPEYRGARFAYGADLRYLCGRLGVPYQHLLDLAPTKELRRRYHEVADNKSSTQRDRMEAWTQFLKDYVAMLVQNKVLHTDAPLGQIVRGTEHKAIAIMCSCEHHVDCHRRAAAGLLGRFVKDVRLEHLAADTVGGRTPRYKSPRRYLCEPIAAADLQPNLPGRR